MSYAKDVLYQIQQNEKKYQQDKMEVTHDPLLKEYIILLKNKNDEAVKNLNLCKTFLLKIAELNTGLGKSINEFIERLK